MAISIFGSITLTGNAALAGAVSLKVVHGYLDNLPNAALGTPVAAVPSLKAMASAPQSQPVAIWHKSLLPPSFGPPKSGGGAACALPSQSPATS
jgi:hypothetical protein